MATKDNLKQTEEIVSRNDYDKFQPCDSGCCVFQNFGKMFVRLDRIPPWSGKAKSECGVHLMYRSELPGLKTEAHWIKLPDREKLLDLYRIENYESKSLEACLNPLRFDPTTGLGEAHEWIRRFLFHEHGWFHLAIYAGCMKSFVEAMEEIEVVILPYGCVYENLETIEDGEEGWLLNHLRQMIVVVRDVYVDSFYEAMQKAKNGMQSYFQSKCRFKNICNEIETVEHLIALITKLSRPLFLRLMSDGYKNISYVIFNPVVDDATWWMNLLNPFVNLNEEIRGNISLEDITRFEKRGGELGFNAATELQFKNCVVRFDPLYQRIGDRVTNLSEHITDNRPFVYDLRGDRVLNVEEMRDVPFSIALSKESRWPFVKWCIFTQTNTLLNLNDDSWVRMHSDDCYDSDEECICYKKTYKNYFRPSKEESIEMKHYFDKRINCVAIEKNDKEWLAYLWHTKQTS